MDMRISDLVSRLEQIKESEGDLTVNLANYLEETVIAGVSDVTVKNQMVVLAHTDGGELTKMDMSRLGIYGRVEGKRGRPIFEG